MLLALFAAASCTGNFDDYNHNPNETRDDELQRDNYLVGSDLVQLQSTVIPTEEHLYQFSEILAAGAHGHYWEGTAIWPQKFIQGDEPENWSKAVFNDPMTDLYPSYRDILLRTDDPVILALAKLLRVATMHRQTDLYGPMPYSKILENKKGQLTVAYDSQQQIYSQMFVELDEALAVFAQNTDLSTEAFGDYDLVYGGRIDKWMLFANSLKLRMALRLSYVDEATARAKATEAIAGGVIQDNADNAQVQPSVNRLAMIFTNWKDHVISADLDSYMNGYNDPRLPKMFTPVEVKETITDPETGKPVEVTRQVYRGMRVGITPTSTEAAKAQCSFPVISDLSPILWMNAAEVAFLRSEYEMRWGTMSEAGNYYKKGVQLSFAEKGLTKADADTYLSDVSRRPAAYVDPMEGSYSFPAQSSVTPLWSDEDVAETALERIITQKWIAIYPLGNEAWAEYRRTGYPRLMPIPDQYNMSGGTIDTRYGARRLSYPPQEYAENRANVEAAVQNMLGGPDNGGTRLWWDVKPLN